MSPTATQRNICALQMLLDRAVGRLHEARMEVARREEEIRHLRTRLAEVVTNRHDRE